MKKYNIIVADKAHISIKEIALHKLTFTPKPSVKKFVDGFYTDVMKLETFPYRGFDLPNESKGRVYENHTIVYEIIPPNIVHILDIVDPRQYSKAKKYT